MRTVGKVILIVVIVLIILVIRIYLGLKKIWTNILTAPMTPENYIIEVMTGGDLEAKYIASGRYETSYFEADYLENADIKKIEV